MEASADSDRPSGIGDDSNGKRNRGRLGRILQYVALIVFGTAVSLYFGRLGFMPLDHSIAFDGGWRVLCGQVPYRDFMAPNCAPVFIAQAVFFGLFGVNWFVYCLHAALVNGLFCLIVYAILRRMGASNTVAFGYGLLSGLALYPLVGTPFMEQHAFFLIAVAILAAIEARRAERIRTKWLLYGAIPLLLAIAFLCKQNPTGFAGPLMLVIVFLLPGPNRDWRIALSALVAGTIATVVVAAVLVLALRLDAGAVGYYVIEMPLRIGRHRAAGRGLPQLLSEIQAFVGWTGAPALVGGLCAASAAYRALSWASARSGRAGRRTLRTVLWIGVLLVIALVLYGTAKVFYPAAWIVFALSLVLFVILSWRVNPREMSVRFGPLLLASLLYALSVAFVLTTANQPENGYPFRFLCLGIATAEAFRAVGRKRKWAAILLCSLCVVVAGGELIRVERSAVSREVNDMTYQPQIAKPCTVTGLKFLSFYLPPEWRMSMDDLDRTVAFLKRNPGNFILIGYFSIL